MKRLLFLSSCLLFFFTSLYAQGRYEYWIDGNLAERQQGTYDGDNFNSLLDLSSYPDGVHQLNFRFADKDGLWSSPINAYILKRKHLTNNMIDGYVYWLDDDIENRKKVEATDGTLLLDIDANALPLGVHTIRTYAYDKYGNKSCPITSVFINKGKYFAENKIQTMEYWVNGNINDRQSVSLDTDSPILNLECSILLEGADRDIPNTLYYRFKDVNGKWSCLQSAVFTVKYVFYHFLSLNHKSVCFTLPLFNKDRVQFEFNAIYFFSLPSSEGKDVIVERIVSELQVRSVG